MLAEASLLRELTGCKWFPAFYGVVEPNKLLLEFIEGYTLQHILSNEKEIEYWL